VDEKHRRFVKKRFTRRIGHGEQVPATSEFEVIAKTGEHIPVETTGTIIRHRGEPADLVIMRDIRDRKRVEEEHLMLEKLATIGKLATMVAHDMRNPLTSIRNASFYLKNTCPHRGEPGCKTAVEMLEIIEQETLFANSIISDLLDFAVKKPLQRKKQSINKLIDTSLIVSDIPENIKVRRKLAEKAIAAVDEKQLKRVFLNTVKNAVQAMPKGGNLTIKTNERKDQIEIAFTDTGIGIREENMGKLFQPLFTTKAKGIGMGLAICKRIVEQHRGTINVKSKIAKGTTFTINLPKDGGRR
jgi:signal transduction histidine kinase